MSIKKETASNKETKSIWSLQEKELSRSRYGCEILLEKCTLEETRNKQLPNDAYIVSYYDEGELCYDMTRAGKRANIFDMYWDKIREDLVSITFGYGVVNPLTWGYQAPKPKKRK